MKHVLLIALALAISVTSLIGMVASCLSDIQSLDTLALIQTACFGGLILSCRLVSVLGDRSDTTAAPETGG
jgi:hypothetical protein